jgi:CheY-like chemotaxis protein
MSAPRVVLVEDEAPLRRFVNMALEELPITLIECDGVAAALQALNEAPAQLILTDLMMPGESGLDLLEHLRKTPALRGEAKVIVFSAGLTAPMRQQLAHYDVLHMIDKPVSVRQLESMVAQAVLGDGPSAPTTSPAAPANPPALEASDAQQAADQYFEGDMDFYQSYRSTCLEQFPHDIAQGDHACQVQDLATLRRVAHSLKSVLITLGYPRLSAQAASLETLSHQGQTVQALAAWPDLRAPLQQLLANG